MQNNPKFYTDLQRHESSLRELLNNDNLFTPVPSDWHVILVEVSEQSKETHNEFYNDLNLATTGSIISVLNTIKAIDNTIKVPYFFRGNGAAFLIPEMALQQVNEALQNYALHVFKVFKFVLKIGDVKMEEVYKLGATFRVSKLKLNKYLTTPVVLGNGIIAAKKLSRAKTQNESHINEQKPFVNLNGMECRWKEVFPNEHEKKVLCLLVVCEDESLQVEVFTKIMDEIDYIFGNLKERSPISTIKLKLDNSFIKMRKEMYARLGKFDRGYLVQNWLITYFGKFYFKYFVGGKNYLNRVSQLSDTIILDGTINTVFSGTDKQVKNLKLLLDTMESDRKITYGIHETYASIMSCYIEDRDENHIHFVDGTEGGYMSAALHIKSKRDKSNTYFRK